MRLTFRDKIFFGLGIAVIILVALFFLAIKPLNTEIKENKVTLEEVQKERDEVDAKIAEIEPLKKEIKDTYAETKKLTADFVEYNSIYESTKVDQYMQHFAEDAEVKIMSLSAGNIGTSALGYYYFKPTVVGKNMYDQADVNGRRAKADAEENAAVESLDSRNVEDVLQSQYTIVVTAEDKEQIWEYMKLLEEQKETILINAVSLGNIEIKENPDNQIKPEDKEANPPTATFVVTLYSVYEMDEPDVEMH